MSQYGTVSAIDRVRDALAAAGFSHGIIDPQALAPLDQFHAGGLQATAKLARDVEIQRGSSLLDVGCGLGGPARFIASEYDCSVTGIDLNEPFVEIATMLTERTNLSDRVAHLVADATDLPFEGRLFDNAITMHVAMNIADRDRLYRGVFEVLRPGGNFGIYDIVADNGEALAFPVPWADEPAQSHLRTAAETRALLEAAGFVITSWVDMSDDALAWTKQQVETISTAPPTSRALSLPLVLGPRFPEAAANIGRNAAAGRIRVIMAIARKPA